MKYEVQFAGITGADGDLHRRGEILDESEISDLERQIAIGAVAPVAVAEEVQTSAPDEGSAPPVDELTGDDDQPDDPPAAVKPTKGKVKK